MKKEWQKPEMIVLVRHAPEEAVLTTGKEYIGMTLSGPTDYDGACMLANVYAGCSAESAT